MSKPFDNSNNALIIKGSNFQLKGQSETIKSDQRVK